MKFRKFILLFFSTVSFLLILALWVDRSCNRVTLNPLLNSESQLLQDNYTSKDILVIYSGRWMFLRVQLAHIYRELRKNGGILDHVWFMMVRYDSITHEKIKHFTKVANEASQEDIFSIHYLGSKPGKAPSDYTRPYYEMFSHLVQNPYDKFFKFDDDIVYIRPRAFNYLLQQNDASKCFMHFFNIAGSNWRCSWLHQKNGVYIETNPNRLEFEYNPNGNCGWKSAECAELTLRTFLHHYKHQQLNKFYFTDLELTTDRKRFSINAFLLDKDLIDIKAMLETGKIRRDDEAWWTMHYSAKVAHPNCIVGEALVVHFAYSTVVNKLLSRGLLDEFVSIVTKNKNSFKIEEVVWKALDF